MDMIITKQEGIQQEEKAKYEQIEIRAIKGTNMTCNTQNNSQYTTLL